MQITVPDIFWYCAGWVVGLVKGGDVKMNKV